MINEKIVGESIWNKNKPNRKHINLMSIDWVYTLDFRVLYLMVSTDLSHYTYRSRALFYSYYFSLAYRSSAIFLSLLHFLNNKILDVIHTNLVLGRKRIELIREWGIGSN